MEFIIDADQLNKLTLIAARLQSGTDRERDEGHKLWLLINQIKDQEVTSDWNDNRAERFATGQY
jgi:hypothetical protein